MPWREHVIGLDPVWVPLARFHSLLQGCPGAVSDPTILLKSPQFGVAVASL